MKEGSICQKDTAILNVDSPNNRATKPDGAKRRNRQIHRYSWILQHPSQTIDRIKTENH